MKNLPFLSRFTPQMIANDWQREWFHRMLRNFHSLPGNACNQLPAHSFNFIVVGGYTRLMPCQSEETDMRKRLSELKARGADIVGHGSVLKVLLISLGLLAAAFIIVFMVA